VSLPQVCSTRLPELRIACVAPADAASVSQPSARQRAFNLFSWQTFLALNWPAGERRGESDAGKRIGDPGARVWETWPETSEVYLPDGRRPAPWDSRASLAPIKRLYRTQQKNAALGAAVQPTGADGTLPVTLTDRNGHLVRFEIRMNRIAFDYVVAHRLYDPRVQARAEAVSFPEGAIIAKAAWRELARGEETRYLTRDAELCDERGRDCRRSTVGLVGFHLMVKTKSAPQWVWATFEQVDNVAGDHPSFFETACRDCDNVINRQTPAGVPNQVVRMTPIPAADPDCASPEPNDNVAALNRAVAAALADQGTLAYYELVNTQWPLVPGKPATVFQAAPPLLANTTLETFIQRSSSCMGCHAMARTERTDRFVAGDFTFTFTDALPDPPPPRAFTPADPGSPLHARARAISDRTYEMVAPPTVVARLHCSSCHLQAGTNPQAAWWVGSADRYPTRARLFQRINQCFRNSMAGQDACGSPADCARNPDMMSLVGYIEDLTKKWRQLHGSRPAPSAFPTLATLTPDPAKGSAIFLQKCAFCHGPNGEGRYESNTYFRPALWGTGAFDAEAGMARVATMAAFVHANMPLGSGGELTEQEAWDVAAFIAAQCRPRKPGCKP
jgi:cytochrome c